MHINRAALFILFSNDLAFHESIALLSIYNCYRKWLGDESNEKYRPTQEKKSIPISYIPTDISNID